MELVRSIQSGDVIFHIWRNENGETWTTKELADLSPQEAVEKLRSYKFPEKYLFPIQKKTLKTKVVIEGKETPIESFEIARKWAKEKFPMSLLLLGSVGTGKTQAVVAAAWWLLMKRKIMSARFYSAMELRNAFEKGELLQDIREVDLLIIDDLGREYKSDFNTYIVETVITSRYDLQKPVCITANITFDDIAKRYTPRVLDRIQEWAYRKIIKQKFSLRGIL